MQNKVGRAFSRAGASATLTALASVVAAGGAVIGAAPAWAVAPIGECRSTCYPGAAPAPTRPPAAGVHTASRPKALYRQARRPAPVTRPVADHTVVAATAPRSASAVPGYSLVGTSGGVYPFGTSGHGSILGRRLGAPITAAASLPDGSGYWMAGSDGGVFAFGRAGFHGALSPTALHAPVVGMAADPRTGGYWLVSADGGVFAFDAPYYGSASRLALHSRVVGITATPDGRGYWVVGSDGGVFAFGDAHYAGGASGHRLQATVVGLAATADGRGYWLAGADGGVFAFGDAGYYGAPARSRLQAPVVAITATPDGRGYWIVGSDGGVFAYGDAPYLGGGHIGALATQPANQPGVQGAAGAGAAHPTAPAATVHPAARSTVAAAVDGAAPAVHAAVQPVRWGEASHQAALPGGAAPVSYPTSYPSGATGFDISRYQCHSLPAAPHSVAVVQVSGGALRSEPNPCYAEEALWAGPNLSVYVYLDGLPGPGLPAAMSGPAGRCALVNLGCQGYNYGYNWTQHWVTYSRSLGIGPRLWWLDVEGRSGWGPVPVNQTLIRGAVAALNAYGIRAGIYSTADQWQVIAGGLAFPGIPVWTAGAGNLAGPGYTAASYCAAGRQAFAGGYVSMVQWGYTGSFPGAYKGPVRYDQDFACR